AEGAVDGAVVASERDGHELAGLDLALLDIDAFLAGADREDGAMGRVDHGGEMLDAVHAEVGDRGRPALVFVRRELLVARPRREVLHLLAYLAKRLLFALVDDRREQPAGHRDRDRDVR